MVILEFVKRGKLPWNVAELLRFERGMNGYTVGGVEMIVHVDVPRCVCAELACVEKLRC